MWKRDENVRPSSSGAGTGQPPQARSTSDAASPSRRELETPPDSALNIGKSIVIKGELNGSEDLAIQGQVEGTIELRQHVLTVGPNGKIRAQIFAKSVVVQGEVTGNITATEKVEIRDSGSVDGDLVSPRVAIAEGAHFRGSIDMQRGPTAAQASESLAGVKPLAVAATAQKSS